MRTENWEMNGAGRPRVEERKSWPIAAYFLPLLAGLCVAGCAAAPTAQKVEESIEEPSEAASNELSEGRVEIRTLRGVSLRSVNGAPVPPREVLVAPGTQSVRVDVRRSLDDLRNARVEGIYSVGSCRILLDGKAGDRYAIKAVPFSAERQVESLDEDEEEKSKNRTGEMVGVTLRVVNRNTEEEFVVSANSCQLRLDCSGVDRTKLRPGPACTF